MNILQIVRGKWISKLQLNMLGSFTLWSEPMLVLRIDKNRIIWNSPHKIYFVWGEGGGGVNGLLVKRELVMFQSTNCYISTMNSLITLQHFFKDVCKCVQMYSKGMQSWLFRVEMIEHIFKWNSSETKTFGAAVNLEISRRAL